MSGISPADEIMMQKMFYYPVCNQQEIERIFNVRNARDYQLKLRADTIVDHMRLFRVYRNKALANEAHWSLERSFNTAHYQRFLEALPEELNMICAKVQYGDIFSNDPNGWIEKTEYGPIISISQSLEFFLKFMHLALLDFQDVVPPHVRRNALRIAIRVMLKTEALDFYMDPRGIIPFSVSEAIHAPIPHQMQFIAGHEFAHYFLGHLSDNNTYSHPVYYAISPSDKDYKPLTVYNTSQINEFAADTQAIITPMLESDERLILFEAALLWFCNLSLYEAVVDTVWPRSPWDYCTHPSACDRFEHLLSSVPTPAGFDLQKWKAISKFIEIIRPEVIDDVNSYYDFYEKYGSAYLDAPETEWRGKELIDRIDYY